MTPYLITAMVLAGIGVISVGALIFTNNWRWLIPTISASLLVMLFVFLGR